MRRVVVLAFVAACYRPDHPASCLASCATDACPFGLSCDHGLCVAPGDSCSDGGLPDGAPGDAAPVICELPVNYAHSHSLLAGTSYTVAGSTAVYQDVTIFETPIDSMIPGTQISPAFPASAPRLAPDGQEVFAVGLPTGTPALVKATRVGLSWGPFAAVRVNGVSITTEFVPGVPTLTNPRLMVVESSPNVFVELTEVMPDVWNMVEMYDLSVIPVVKMTQPALSTDGKNLIFVGQINNPSGPAQIIALTREDVGSAFVTPKIVYTNNNELATPALNADCTALYVTIIDQVTKLTP